MAEIMVTDQRAAELEALRRAAEERARRKKAIESQIEQWNDELTTVRAQLSSLTTERSNLNTYLGDWDGQKSTYSGNEILSEVVVANVFEGVCADRVKAVLSGSIKEMDQTCSRVSGLNGNVDLQIERLNQYTSVIHTNLASLRNELSSI